MTFWTFILALIIQWYIYWRLWLDTLHLDLEYNNFEIFDSWSVSNWASSEINTFIPGSSLIIPNLISAKLTLFWYLGCWYSWTAAILYSKSLHEKFARKCCWASLKPKHDSRSPLLLVVPKAIFWKFRTHSRIVFHDGTIQRGGTLKSKRSCRCVRSQNCYLWRTFQWQTPGVQ